MAAAWGDSSYVRGDALQRRRQVRALLREDDPPHRGLDDFHTSAAKSAEQDREEDQEESHDQPPQAAMAAAIRSAV